MKYRIRLSKLTQKGNSCYEIVASKLRSARDTHHLDKLGLYVYNLKTNNRYVYLDFEKTKYWLSVGAIPTDPCQALLARSGLLPAHPKIDYTNDDKLELPNKQKEEE